MYTRNDNTELYLFPESVYTVCLHNASFDVSLLSFHSGWKMRYQFSKRLPSLLIAFQYLLAYF